MRHVNFQKIRGNDTNVIGHYYDEKYQLVDIRNYYLPEDHCTIGPDIVDWINNGNKPCHSAQHGHDGTCVNVTRVNPAP